MSFVPEEGAKAQGRPCTGLERSDPSIAEPGVWLWRTAGSTEDDIIHTERATRNLLSGYQRIHERNETPWGYLVTGFQ